MLAYALAVSADLAVLASPIDNGSDASAVEIQCPVMTGTYTRCKHTVGPFIDPTSDDAIGAVRLHIAARSARTDSAGKAHRRHWDNKL